MLSLNNEMYGFLSKFGDPILNKMDIDTSYKNNVQNIFIRKQNNSAPHVVYSMTEKENHKILFDIYKDLKDIIETEFETFAANTTETDQFVSIEGFLKKYEGVSFRLDCNPSIDMTEVSFCYK